jgi:Xaa-Pro aminopeptidase/Xaa-Pro dipeptidase
MDGVLIFDLKNIRYLVGFTGSAGILFVGREKIILAVDGRYTIQAATETSDCEIVEFRDILQGMAGVIGDLRLSSVGFEAPAISFDSYAKLKEHSGHVALRPLPDDFKSLRIVKEQGEIDLLKKAASISAGALLETMKTIRPGVTEKDIVLDLEFRMGKGGGEKLSFETIVASGSHAALPHAKPRLHGVEHGDFVVIDYGTVYQGYHSDETCTLAVGKVTGEWKKIYGIVKDAHDRALDAIKAGKRCKDIDAEARNCIEEKGYGQFFSHGTGHGVGLDVHEAPKISRESSDYLEEGMVITIEPGIYIPEVLGVRIEDMALVQKDGCEILTKIPKDLKVL